MCTEIPIDLGIIILDNLKFKDIDFKDYKTYLKQHTQSLNNIQVAHLPNKHEVGDIFRLHSVDLKHIYVFRFDEIIPSHRIPMFDRIYEKIRIFVPLDDYVYIMIKSKITHLTQGKMWYVPVNLYHTMFAKGQLVLAYDIVPDYRMTSFIDITKEKNHNRKEEKLRTLLLRHRHANFKHF